MSYSALFPSKNRPERLRSSLEKLCRTAPSVEIICAFDNGDSGVAVANSFKQVSMILSTGQDFTPANYKYNFAMSRASGEWLITGSDDLVWHDGWFKAACQCDNDGFVGLYDGHTPIDAYATHVMIHRDVIASCWGGYFSFPWYKSWFSDLEGKERIVRKGLRYIVCKEAFVEHAHAAWGSAEWDATYRLGEQFHDADRAEYERRKALGFPD